MGGYPAAHLRASIGDEKNTISSDPKADHILDEISAEEITNPDGTVDVKKKFTLPVTNFFVFSSHELHSFILLKTSFICLFLNGPYDAASCTIALAPFNITYNLYVHLFVKLNIQDSL